MSQFTLFKNERILWHFAGACGFTPEMYKASFEGQERILVRAFFFLLYAHNHAINMALGRKGGALREYPVPAFLVEGMTFFMSDEERSYAFPEYESWSRYSLDEEEILKILSQPFNTNVYKMHWERDGMLNAEVANYALIFQDFGRALVAYLNKKFELNQFDEVNDLYMSYVCADGRWVYDFRFYSSAVTFNSSELFLSLEVPEVIRGNPIEVLQKNIKQLKYWTRYNENPVLNN